MGHHGGPQRRPSREHPNARHGRGAVGASISRTRSLPPIASEAAAEAPSRMAPRLDPGMSVALPVASLDFLLHPVQEPRRVRLGPVRLGPVVALPVGRPVAGMEAARREPSDVAEAATDHQPEPAG